MRDMPATSSATEAPGLTPAPDVAGVNECCKDAMNLERIEVRMPFTMDRCMVCGNRHRRVHVDLNALVRR